MPPFSSFQQKKERIAPSAIVGVIEGSVMFVRNRRKTKIYGTWKPSFHE